jgi:hypothetical protein
LTFSGDSNEPFNENHELIAQNGNQTNRRTHLTNGERSAAFTPLQLSMVKVPAKINWLADVEAG